MRVAALLLLVTPVRARNYGPWEKEYARTHGGQYPPEGIGARGAGDGISFEEGSMVQTPQMYSRPNYQMMMDPQGQMMPQQGRLAALLPQGNPLDIQMRQQEAQLLRQQLAQVLAQQQWPQGPRMVPMMSKFDRLVDPAESTTDANQVDLAATSNTKVVATGKGDRLVDNNPGVDVMQYAMATKGDRLVDNNPGVDVMRVKLDNLAGKRRDGIDVMATNAKLDNLAGKRRDGIDVMANNAKLDNLAGKRRDGIDVMSFSGRLDNMASKGRDGIDVMATSVRPDRLVDPIDVSGRLDNLASKRRDGIDVSRLDNLASKRRDGIDVMATSVRPDRLVDGDLVDCMQPPCNQLTDHRPVGKAVGLPKTRSAKMLAAVFVAAVVVAGIAGWGWGKMTRRSHREEFETLL